MSYRRAAADIIGATPSEPLYFVHISDTHIGPHADYNRHGHYPLPCAERVVEIINNLPVTPDFVIHTGDIVTDPHPNSYKLAAKVFGRLKVPIYYVTGNHDRARDIHQYLSMGPKQEATDNKDALSYAFDIKGYRFLVVDARAPDEIDPHGLLSEDQLEFVRENVQPLGPPLTLFMHYPILTMNSVWMDAYMLVINGGALHKLLLPAKERLRGVFYGHIHQNMQSVRDGITYISVASVFSQFGAWPNDMTTSYDPDHSPGYNFVHMLPEQMIVHQHTFLRPNGKGPTENF